MPRKTTRNPVDLKAQIDQIAGDEAAQPAEERASAAASAAAAVPAPPATDAAMPKLVHAPEPAPGAEPRPSGGTSPAKALDTPPPAPKRERKRHRGPHITVRLDEELHTGIKQMAADIERSVENMVRRILRRAISDHKAAKAKDDIDAIE